MVRAVTVVCLALAAHAVGGLPATSLAWQARYDGILENREYGIGGPARSQTFFLGRLHLGAGLTFDSLHGIRVEGMLLEEFGSSQFADDWNVAVWYQYRGRVCAFDMGIFPRRDIGTYPRALLDDSLNWYRPYVEGGEVRVAGTWGHQSVWVDWTGRQTRSVREQFLVGLDGGIQWRWLFGDYHMVYYHNAGRDVEPPDPLSENYAGRGRAGVEFTPRTFFDTIRVAVGAIGSADRTRGAGGWRTPVGFCATVDIQMRRGGVRAEAYTGDSLVTSWGNQLYRYGRYMRADIYALPIRGDHVRAEFAWSVHVAGERLNHTQMFLLTAELGGSRRLSAAP